MKKANILVSDMIDALYEGDPPPVSIDVGLDRLHEAIADVESIAARLPMPNRLHRLIYFADTPERWADTKAICIVKSEQLVKPDELPADYLDYAPEVRRFMEWLLDWLAKYGTDEDMIEIHWPGLADNPDEFDGGPCNSM